MTAFAVVVCLVLWGGFSWDKTATMRTELEKKVREELKAEAVQEEVKAKTVRENLEAEAALRTQLEKKVREELNAEAALRTQLEKKVREELKAEAGGEITALEKHNLFESGMAYTTRDIYEKGMSNGEIKGRNRALAAQVWALGAVHGEGRRQGDSAGPELTHNVGPEPIHIVKLEPVDSAGLEPLHDAGLKRGHVAGLERGRNVRAERGRNAEPECGGNARPREDRNNAGPRSGHVSRRIRGGRQASTEASDDGREEQHGGHR
ncbi:hypothetical protein G7Y79_00001g000900 [Physcia stellaris]|nr:hypothetical protein G7Y79_00001g000900 [Physcia stellaris]